MFGWIIGKILGFASSGILQKALDVYNKTQDTQVKLKEVDADVAKEAMKLYVDAFRIQSEENKEKWKLPIFNWVAGTVLMTVAGYFLMLTLYNIFWHSKGIWPQPWTIAAYPGLYEGWANTAFNWVFAPAVGLGALLAIARR